MSLTMKGVAGQRRGGFNFMKFNINNKIRFKITEHGWDYIRDKNKTDPVYKRYPITFKVDSDGYCTKQLWSVMEFFGAGMTMGFQLLFETDIELIFPKSDSNLHLTI